MPAEQPPTINWSLKKMLVREDLDLSSQAGEAFLTWKSQFTNFLPQSGASREGVPWEAKWAALESRVGYLHKHSKTENMDNILAAVTEVAGAIKNTDSQTQIQRMPPKNNQPFKLFYSELMTLASSCKFNEELCDADKQKVIDSFLLNKIIFSIHDRAAQKKLFKEKEINLTKAIKIIEVPKSSGAILSHISTQIEQVGIDVYTDAGKVMKSNLSLTRAPTGP